MDPLTQELVAGRFRVQREVGRGGVGIVYLAFDQETKRHVALKIIASAGVDPVEQARFTREGQILSELDHPSIVRVVAFGALEEGAVDGNGRPLENGAPYVAMEWLEGEDLQARQKRAPLTLRETLEVGRQVSEALAAAHDAGVVHRDIKPSNIFLVDRTESAPPVSGVAPGEASRRASADPAPSEPVDSMRRDRTVDPLRGRRGVQSARQEPRFDATQRDARFGSAPGVPSATASEPSSAQDSAPTPTAGGVLLPPPPPPRAPVAVVPLRTKLVDFGVAASDDVRLTRTGAVVGTPAYMAPEQARGDASPDVRSDIYSLGATLFELIAGRPPHIGPTSIATLARLVTTPAPRLSELMTNVPDELDELVYRMLLHDRDKRPASAREVARQLAEIALDPRIAEVARASVRDTESRGVLGKRFVTTLVALHVGAGDERNRQLVKLREPGADALPLGADSLVAHLGARRAHGDEAARALELGRRLCEAGARVGVATGRMRVDLTRSSGEVVDRASALARDAGQARLVADATTMELARGRFEFELRPNGSAVVGKPLRGRRDGGAVAPFVGREAEFVATLSAYDRCIEDQTPVVVSVSGPPGIGKSRLARELVSSLAARAEPPRMVGVRCESFGRAQALGVATDAIRALVGLPKGSTLAQAIEAIRSRKLRHDEGDVLAHLLANQPFPEDVDQARGERRLDPRGARDALYLSMTELALQSAAREPCALIFEDAQWSDPESIAWLDHLLGRATGRALFVILMMRPSFWRDQAQRFAGRDHVRVELRPMARRATREIARAIIGQNPAGARSDGSGVDDAMLDRIAQQAAGSPLFAEELARVIASGKDATTAPTIEAAIQVSLDALDDAARDAIIKMSILGLSVWDTGVAALGVPDTPGALKKLLAAELLVEQPQSRFAGAREFLFKHALVRDVAYASADEDQRRELHASAGRWFASMGEDSATVAQHFDLGGKHVEASVHWEAAARRALATNSLREAVIMADKALVFAEDKPTAFARALLLEQAYSRLDARSSERDSAIRAMTENVFDEASEVRTLGARARYDDACASGHDVEKRLVEVRDRARALDLVDEEANSAATLALRHAYAGALADAEREAAHLLALADTRHIVSAAVDAYQAMAIVRQTRGELAAALEARRSAARAARTAGLQEREAILTMNVGFALTTIGARQEALHELESGIAKAAAIGSSGAVRHGRMLLLGWAAAFGADARLDAALAEPRASADEAASGVWMVRDRATLGVLFYRGCELLRGDASQLPRARTLLKTSAEAYRSTDNNDLLPVALGFWAEAERRSGEPEHSLEIAREAAERLEAGAPSLLNEAPVYLALHDASVDVGDLRGARSAMERGIPPLLKRLRGLEGTPYARTFLTGLTHNSGLLVAAEAYGYVPEEIERLIEQRSSMMP